MYVIATDLDRTLLPNGKQKYDGSMELFKKVVKSENLGLIFVTGRNLRLLKKAIKEFRPPLPDYVLGDVGTKIYARKGGRFVEDAAWIKRIHSSTRNWNVARFKDQLSKVGGLKIQESYKQNEFKLSYYIYGIKNTRAIVKKASSVIQKICKDAAVVYSIDEVSKTGLMDILPKQATKLQALEYLRKKTGLDKKHIIYCGDSGNDILPLTSGYKSIIVRNAVSGVKKTAVKVLARKRILDRLYIAKGYKRLNGYYVSGIIEGLIKFGVVSPKHL